MLVSVIIPAYNRVQFIRRAIKSVADQDCIDRSRMQIIVIDDGSTDGTAEVAKKIDVAPCALTILRIPHSGEPGTVRNAGLERARGKFIAYCDSDDYWLPHHLATALQEFKKNPRLCMVANYWGLAHFMPRPGGSIETKIIVPPHPKDAVNTNCRIHKRECLAQIGEFGRSKWGEDADFFQRIEATFSNVKTGIVTSVNGYIKGGNNISYQSDAGIKARYF